MKDIKRFVAKARIQTNNRADDAVLGHLLQELSQSKESRRARWRLPAEPRVIRPIAYLTSVAVVIVAVAWLVHPREVPRQRPPAAVEAASRSGIALLTEISLERAFRHGGIQAVQDQCEKALATSTKEPDDSSLKTLLAELADNGKDTGGMSL